jgi:hypothetical protein
MGSGIFCDFKDNFYGVVHFTVYLKTARNWSGVTEVHYTNRVTWAVVDWLIFYSGASQTP